MKNIETVTV